MQEIVKMAKQGYLMLVIPSGMYMFYANYNVKEGQECYGDEFRPFYGFGALDVTWREQLIPLLNVDRSKNSSLHFQYSNSRGTQS